MQGNKIEETEHPSFWGPLYIGIECKAGVLFLGIMDWEGRGSFGVNSKSLQIRVTIVNFYSPKSEKIPDLYKGQ